MKNKLVFCLILMAALFPQWAAPINLTATASWLWLPEFKFQWKVVEGFFELFFQKVFLKRSF